jgi:hypothetical protein
MLHDSGRRASVWTTTPELRPVAVTAQDLEPVRILERKPPCGPSLVLAILGTIVVDMIQVKEHILRFTAALALATK